jgi:hypothetical protein
MIVILQFVYVFELEVLRGVLYPEADSNRFEKKKKNPGNDLYSVFGFASVGPEYPLLSYTRILPSRNKHGWTAAGSQVRDSQFWGEKEGREWGRF